MIERQEIHCHECNRYVHFDVDTSLNGNHVLHCPNCGHEHCRVVKDGMITDVRWDSRNGPTFAVATSSVTTSTVSVYLTSGTTGTTASGHMFLAQSWLNSTSTS